MEVIKAYATPTPTPHTHTHTHVYRAVKHGKGKTVGGEISRLAATA